MHLSRVGLAFLVLFLTSALLFSNKVRFDYDHSADFSQYETYSWLIEPNTPKNPFLKQRIVDWINMQMAAKGLHRVDANGELALAVHVAAQDKQSVSTFYDGYGGWYWGMGGVTTTVYEYTEGTLIADMFDGKSHKIVWRGTVTREVSDKPEKLSKQTKSAIEKLFKKFPPTED